MKQWLLPIAAALALPAQAQVEKTEEGAQAFLAQKLNRSRILQFPTVFGDGSYTGYWSEAKSLGEWRRTGRCQTKLVNQTDIDWSHSTRLAADPENFDLEVRDRLVSYRVRFNLKQLDSADRQRIIAALTYLLDVCDTSRATGF